MGTLQRVLSDHRKLPDLKPLYGAMFADMLAAHTHWGWMDLDVVFGDTTPLVQAALQGFDVITYPDSVCFPAQTCTPFTRHPS